MPTLCARHAVLSPDLLKRALPKESKEESPAGTHRHVRARTGTYGIRKPLPLADTLYIRCQHEGIRYPHGACLARRMSS